ncbi:MAG: hypothetical protein IPK13_03130 [Deltaproteobacteria bacterium]|nr:hypothetical protein [Deltaproteobacteria bacterium]
MRTQGPIRSPPADQLRARLQKTAELTPRSYPQGLPEFIPKTSRVAIIEGPELRAFEGSTGGLIRGTSLRHSREYSGSQVIRHDALGPGVLDGYDAVIVVAHGAPNETMWGGDRIGEPGRAGYREMPGYTTLEGAALGSKIKEAGFRGSRVFLDSCNGGTESRVGALGTSTAQAVATVTGAQVLAARARDDRVASALARGLDGSEDITGTVLQTGDVASDVREGVEPLEVTVPDGGWFVFSPAR